MGARHGALIVGVILGLLLVVAGLLYAHMPTTHAVIGTTACAWIITSALVAHYTDGSKDNADHL